MLIASSGDELAGGCNRRRCNPRHAILLWLQTREAFDAADVVGTGLKLNVRPLIRA
jgi:hypothetical protein